MKSPPVASKPSLSSISTCSMVRPRFISAHTEATSSIALSNRPHAPRAARDPPRSAWARPWGLPISTDRLSLSSMSSVASRGLSRGFEIPHIFTEITAFVAGPRLPRQSYREPGSRSASQLSVDGTRLRNHNRALGACGIGRERPPHRIRETRDRGAFLTAPSSAGVSLSHPYVHRSYLVRTCTRRQGGRVG